MLYQDNVIMHDYCAYVRIKALIFYNYNGIYQIDADLIDYSIP